MGFPGLNASEKKGTRTHCLCFQGAHETCNSSNGLGKPFQQLRTITFVAASNTDVPNPSRWDTGHLPQPPLPHGHTAPGTGCGLSLCGSSSTSAPQSALRAQALPRFVLLGNTGCPLGASLLSHTALLCRGTAPLKGAARTVGQHSHGGLGLAGMAAATYKESSAERPSPLAFPAAARNTDADFLHRAASRSSSRLVPKRSGVDKPTAPAPFPGARCCGCSAGLEAAASRGPRGNCGHERIPAHRRPTVVPSPSSRCCRPRGRERCGALRRLLRCALRRYRAQSAQNAQLRPCLFGKNRKHGQHRAALPSNGAET